MEAKGKRGGRAPIAGAASIPGRTAAAPEPEPPAAIEATVLPAPVGRGSAAEKTVDFPGDALAALAESQAALARGLDAFSLEAAGFAHRSIDTVAQGATEMLAVRTLADAIEVNAGLARRGFAAFLAGSTRLSELGVKVAADAAEPILAQFGKSWLNLARFYP